MSKPIARRLRVTTSQRPTGNAPEGLSAAWWRENVLGISRPALAELLEISAKTVKREETGERVSTEYRLACAALDAKLDQWSWKGTTDFSLVRMPKRVREARNKRAESARKLRD